jgi:hypothetical protein
MNSRPIDIHRRYDLVAEPELDSDFLGVDFSAAGFAGALVEVVEVDGVADGVVDDPESDFGDVVEAELSEARESVR